MSQSIHHLAIIMDGNGRWATRQSLKRLYGHRVGLESVERIVKTCRRFGIKILTLYAFSKENWNRPLSEVNHIMKLIVEFCIKNFQSLITNNIKLTLTGDFNSLPRLVRYTIKQVLRKTKNNSGFHLNLALNYGGRTEILEASQRIITDFEKGTLSLDSIDQDLFRSYLYTALLPDPDLLIRTGGENRISNFLLWQSAFTDIQVTETLWPDFSEDDLLAIVQKKMCFETKKASLPCS